MEQQIERNLEGWTDEELRAEIQKGLDDLGNGKYTEHDESSLHEFFEDIKARGRKRLEAQKMDRDYKDTVVKILGHVYPLRALCKA